jgi:hypothetical protein
MTTSTEPTVARRTLDETPPRALALLTGIGTSRPIHAKLAEVGYTSADHAEGWALLSRTAGYGPGQVLPTLDPEVREAIVALDDHDEALFAIVAASLRRRHPAQASFVLDGIGPSTGSAAVLGVKTLLDRLEALDCAPAREATRAGDKAALATLAARGIDRAERERLLALVNKAESMSPVDSEAPAARAAREARHLAALVELRAWYEEWSAIARAQIKRKDHLIRLGLAARRSRARVTPESDDEGSDGDAS